MKKSVLLITGLFLTILFFDACNKVNEGVSIPGNGKNYRLISSSYINPGGYSILENYTYAGNRIKQYINNVNGSTIEVTDYSYSGDKVIAEKYSYYSEVLQKKDSTEYFFESGKLVAMNHWAKYDSDYSVIAFVEFIYEGDKVVEYKESQKTDNVHRGFYTYENNLLSNYESEYFHTSTDNWVREDLKVFSYANNKLVQQNIGIGGSEQKIVYNYEGEWLARSDFYNIHLTEWNLENYSNYSYNQYGMVDTIVQRAAGGNEVLHKWTYQYEEGESTFGFIQFRKWSYPGMRYPRPM